MEEVFFEDPGFSEKGLDLTLLLIILDMNYKPLKINSLALGIDKAMLNLTEMVG